MKAIRAFALRFALPVFLCGAFWARAAEPSGAVLAWGDNEAGACTVPPGLTKGVGIAGGAYHSVALLTNRTVLAWGDNTYQETNVPAGLTNVLAIAAGGYHSLALKTNRTVTAWGDNYYGQTNVPPGLTNIVAIAAGGYHSLALKSDGTVVAWGDNSYGETNVPVGVTGVAAIAAGALHSLALRSNGTVVAWGDNFDKNGAYAGQTNVPSGLTNVVAIAGGGYHSLALKADGGVVAWGADGAGQRDVPASLTNAVAIAAGAYYSLALRADGTIVAWGDNTYGQTAVPSGLTNAVAISGGWFHSLAMTTAPFLAQRLPVMIALAPQTGTNLSVSVLSSEPYVCLWTLNDSPLAGASGTNVVISNFDLSIAGVYSVTVSNQNGCSASAASILRLTNSPVVLLDGTDVGGGTVVRKYSTQVTMSSSFGSSAEIYYTLDGSAPDYTGNLYQGPFTLSQSATIRAIAYNYTYTALAEAAPITVQVLPAYSLTPATAGGGSIGFSPAPLAAGNLYASNTLVTITATPASGWSFLYWLADAAGTNPSVMLAVTRKLQVQAVFGTAINTNAVGAGSIQLGPNFPLYPFGSTVRVAALPQTGNYFTGWHTALAGTNTPTALVVTAPSPTITATFAPLQTGQYGLTMISDGNGKITASPYATRYSPGQIVVLTAVPDPGQMFLGWSGDATGTANPLNVTMDQSKVVTASFTKRPLLSLPAWGGMTPGGFVLLLAGEWGAAYQISSTSDYSAWQLQGAVTNMFGTVQFTDATATNSPHRFYRALQP
jgi:hypothetical protein